MRSAYWREGTYQRFTVQLFRPCNKLSVKPPTTPLEAYWNCERLGELEGGLIGGRRLIRGFTVYTLGLFNGMGFGGRPPTTLIYRRAFMRARGDRKVPLPWASTRSIRKRLASKREATRNHRLRYISGILTASPSISIRTAYLN